MNKTLNIFLVDDDPLYLAVLKTSLEAQPNFVIKTFASGEQCIAELHKTTDVVVLDYQLDSVDKLAMNGLEVLKQIKATHPKLPVILLSSQDSIEVAVTCMHHQASDYVVKSETAFIRLKKIIKDLSEHKEIEEALEWYMAKL